MDTNMASGGSTDLKSFLRLPNPENKPFSILDIPTLLRVRMIMDLVACQ